MQRSIGRETVFKTGEGRHRQARNTSQLILHRANKHIFQNIKLFIEIISQPLKTSNYPLLIIAVGGECIFIGVIISENVCHQLSLPCVNVHT